MIGEMTLSQAAMAFGGTLLYPDCGFHSVSTDTRRIEPGQLFVALRGENFDAHDFLAQAAEQAAGLIVEQADTALEVPQWVVGDAYKALGQLATLNRDKFDGLTIGLTGSAGKTTVKGMLANIFVQQRGNAAEVHATKGNLNNHIGVPLTLFDLNEQHCVAVVEMGANGVGDIAYLCELARPDVVLITNVMAAHIEGFGSLDGVATAKGEIYDGLTANGTAVVNLDEPYVEQWRASIGDRRCLTFSLANPEADVFADHISEDAFGRCRFQINTPVGSGSVQLRLNGRHNVNNALAAAATAVAAGADFDAIVAGIEAMVPVAGRMDMKQLADDIYLIDDSYNANPSAVKAAIDVLVKLPGERVLILGDMAELGPNEAQLHAEVGRYANDKGLDALLTVGTLTRHSSEAFGAGADHYENKQALIAALPNLLTEEVSILVKGSLSSGMKGVVVALEEAVAAQQNNNQQALEGKSVSHDSSTKGE